MLIWKTYRQEGQCIPLLDHMGICLCLPQSLTRSWTALHPVTCSLAFYYCPTVARLQLRCASRFLLCKHKAVWRRLFHRCISETHCIFAESGCGCNILSVTRGKNKLIIRLHNKERTWQWQFYLSIIIIDGTWLSLPLFRHSFFCSGEASQSICKQLGRE